MMKMQNILKSVKSDKTCVAALSLLVAVALLFNFVSLGIAPTRAGNEPGVEQEGDIDLSQIVLNKYVTDNEDGTYKLTVETYVTGKVTYSEGTVEKPTDIVLLIDRSSSMDTSMRYKDGTTTTRAAAAKAAVAEFIEDIGKHYNAETTDHRISLVVFGNDATVLGESNWHTANAATVSSLTNTIRRYDSFTSSYTNPAAGLTKAKALLDEEYKGSLTDRNKVVVLFTDGVPADSGDTYTQKFAENAITEAKKLKDAGIPIFTVGCFNGVDQDTMYATKEVYGDIFDSYPEHNGAVGDTWTAQNTGIFASSPEQGFAPLGNRFLNLVSSNYPTATQLGLDYSSREDLIWILPPITRVTATFKITANAPAHNDDEQDYYYAANDADTLMTVFKDIAEWIATGGTTVTLTEKAIVRDIVSQYFDIPDYVQEEDVKTYVAKCVGQQQKLDDKSQPMVDAETGEPVMEFIFEDRKDWVDTSTIKEGDDNEEFMKVDVTITDFYDKGDRRNVSVNGFNFSKHYVAYDAEKKMPHGSKLVIEFDIEPIPGFSGGNNVPTNDPKSGICPEPGVEPLVYYPEPHLNIPIPELTFEVVHEEYVIYQGNSLSIDDFMTITDQDDNIYDSYVDREVTVDGVAVIGGIFAPLHTTVYPEGKVEVTVKPKASAEATSVGAPAKPVSGTNKKSMAIYVLEPTINIGLKDLKKYYGESYTLGAGAVTDCGVTWAEPAKADDESYVPKIESDVSKVDGVVKPFASKDIELEYACDGYTGTIGKKDITVTVTPKFKDGTFEGGTPAVAGTAKIAYQTTCDYGCTTGLTDGTYRVHAGTGSVTLNVTGGKPNTVLIYSVLKDGDAYTSLSVVTDADGKGSVTLSELPTGTYTMVSSDDWNWDYTTSFGDNKPTVTLDATTHTGTINCNHTSGGSSFITSISSIVKNIFGQGE